MAFVKHKFFEVLHIAKKNKLNSILMLGRQGAFIDIDDILKWNSIYKYEFDISKIHYDAKNKYIDSVELFNAYGFEDVYCLDYSDYENADILFDLNQEILPTDLVEKFDLVINGGTIEHVFDIAKAMDNMNMLVKKDGFIYHSAPLNNWIGHGFFEINPSFFIDYYNMNEHIFSMEKVCIEIKDNSSVGDSEVILSPDVRELFNLDVYLEKFSSLKMSVVCIAQRNKHGRVYKKRPIQGMYLAMYQKYSSEDINYIVEKIVDKKIALYRMGFYGKKVLTAILERGKEENICKIFDADINKVGSRIAGIEIEFPSSKNIANIEEIVVCVKNNTDQVVGLLRERGFTGNIITLSDA